MMLQPVHQGLVVGVAAQQAHGCVAMAVNQARHQGVPGQFQYLPGLYGLRFLARQQGGDAVVGQGDAVVFQHGAMGNDRYYPTRVNKGICDVCLRAHGGVIPVPRGCLGCSKNRQMAVASVEFGSPRGSITVNVAELPE